MRLLNFKVSFVTDIAVIKRLENVQVNLVDVNDKEELLNISRALRVQQEKAKELENQVKENVTFYLEQLMFFYR